MSVQEMEAELFRIIEAQNIFQARAQQLEPKKNELYQQLNEARRAAQPAAASEGK